MMLLLTLISPFLATFWPCPEKMLFDFCKSFLFYSLWFACKEELFLTSWLALKSVCLCCKLASQIKNLTFSRWKILAGVSWLIQHKIKFQFDFFPRKIILTLFLKSKTSYDSSWRDEMRGRGKNGNGDILEAQTISARIKEKQVWRE